MRGRWASAALGAGIARRRMGSEMDQQAQAHEAEMQRAQQQIDAQQKQLQSQHDDITEKLKKYGELKQQGLITDEEFQKLKADLLSKI
jgi:membrane protease subunit (stomatin/prohibitin family)